MWLCLVLSEMQIHKCSVDFACDTYKYPSITDITIEDHGLV